MTKTKQEATETVKIVGVTKDTHTDTGVRFLNVRFSIGDAKEVHSHEFPIDASEKAITSTLKKIAATRKRDAEIAETSREASKAEAKADKTIEALEGAVIE